MPFVTQFLYYLIIHVLENGGPAWPECTDLRVSNPVVELVKGCKYGNGKQYLMLFILYGFILSQTIKSQIKIFCGWLV